MDIGDSFQRTTDGIMGFLPNLLGFLLILLVGWIVAKVVAAVVRKGLEKAGVDRHLHESRAHDYVERFLPGASPSNGISRVVFWLVFVFFLFSAIGALGIPAVTGFMNAVLAYLPNVIVAIVIFVVAALVSGAVAAGISRVMGDTPTGKVAASVVPALVMVIAFFMILEQLQIAPEIVRIAFAATMGALALGLALAFGLGGRGVAQKLLEDAYSAGRERADDVKDDLRTGRARAEADARRADAQVNAGATAGSATTATATTDGTAPYPTHGARTGDL
ncbi:mechanosensitive ion channel family protein [Oryzobacter sp. R7]|uniref:mechanosensitive ion channel family protein n=1 Tax=Oryzobacter faecalis TaxID=3388656 RepID=UPI00398D538E